MKQTAITEQKPGNRGECSSCKGTKFISDYERGEVYCSKCGLVIEDTLFDFGPEWRAFDREQLDKRARTGGLLRYAKLGKGLTTEIDKYDRDIKGKAIPAERKAKFYRLRKWQTRSKMATSLQRNLSKALPELDRMCSYLKIPGNVKEESALLYRKCAEKGIVKGRSIESMVAAIIYLVTRKNKIPRTLEELEVASGVKKKLISGSFRKIVHEMKIKMPVTTAADYVPSLAVRLEASGETMAKAIEIVEKAKQTSVTTGKVPISVAIAALYLAADTVKDEKMKRNVKFPGISKNTIQSRYDELLKKVIGKDPAEEPKTKKQTG
ncbi:MAG: transcription initiation factor IIB [Candidatus Altiarchaeota archaeon]|nr:transcription initiation factor IIB [Candidatus Altiarchaeota archaeon]